MARSTSYEVLSGTNPYLDDRNAHADQDGLTNLVEYLAGLDAGDPDTDGDGWDDGAEKAYWESLQTPCPLGDWAVCATTYDVDGDSVADGDEVSGWYVYIVLPRPEGDTGTVGDVLNPVVEVFVTSSPSDADTDDDGLRDGDEYLRTDPEA